MSRRAQEDHLLAKLRQSLGLDSRGFTAVSEPRSGVLILYNSHYRGIWHWQGGVFTFTPGGYGTPTFSATTAHEAVLYTLDHVCRQGA
jgi:hypothetical protein